MVWQQINSRSKNTKVFIRACTIRVYLLADEFCESGLRRLGSWLSGKSRDRRQDTAPCGIFIAKFSLYGIGLGLGGRELAETAPTARVGTNPLARFTVPCGRAAVNAIQMKRTRVHRLTVEGLWRVSGAESRPPGAKAQIISCRLSGTAEAGPSRVASRDYVTISGS